MKTALPFGYRSRMIGSSLFALAACSALLACEEPGVLEGVDGGRDGSTNSRTDGAVSDGNPVVIPDGGNGGGDDGGDGGGGPRRCGVDADCDDQEGCTLDRCVVARGVCEYTMDNSCHSLRTGRNGRMFSPDGRQGVEYDPDADGLVVRAESRRADYLWVPNVAESTVSKWDATTATEIARYRVGLAEGECRGRCCHENGCNMPSRVVVDNVGDCYVANRGFGMQGTVSKMAADRRDCVDRNGNGMIDTSSGPMDVRPFGEDECVLWTSPVGAPNSILRSLAVDNGTLDDPRGAPWVGSCGDANFGAMGNAGYFKLDPRTGRVLSNTAGGRCLYGAVVTRDNTLWEHALGEGIIPINTTTGTAGAMVPLPAALRPACLSANTWERTYGITTDGRRIWLSGSSCGDVVGYDPETMQWTRAQVAQAAGLPQATFVGSGVTVDPMGRVWAPIGGNPTRLMHFDATSFVPNGNVPLAAITTRTIMREFGTSAIGADRAGQIWIASAAAGTPLLRFNPMTNATDAFTGPNQVYTYTDFTGAVRRLVIENGSYREDYETCEGGTYGELYWSGDTPAGTSLAFSIQIAATQPALAMAPVIPLGVAPRDRSPINIAAKLRDAGVMNLGRFARITVTFVPVSMPMVSSPVLRSLSFTWRCGGVG